MLAGILQKVELNDVDKLKKSGYYFSISDIIDLAKNMEPEE